MKRALYILAFTLVTIVLVTIIKPSSFRSGISRQTSGTVSSVYQVGRDVIVKLSGFKTTFCLSKKLNILELKNLLLGKKVSIQYTDCWTPLDPGSKKHIAELSVEEKVLYSEKSEN